MIDMAIVGGILLNIGAFLTMKGKIYHSVVVYLIADICWVFMAYKEENHLGMWFIILGTLFGLLAFIKMYSGKMSKNL